METWNSPSSSPTFPTHPALRPTSLEDERSKLLCTVSDPIRESPGTSHSYVSYQITTHSTLPVFQKQDFKVRRRFNDFVFLHNLLVQKYAACAIPPLPEKHSSTYIKGGRFDADFTTKRCHSLHRFIERCALHPTLKRAPELHIFLESFDWNTYIKSANHNRSSTMDGGVLDGFQEAWMNTFTKPAKADKRFTDIRDVTDILARDLLSTEKWISKIIRKETDLEIDIGEMANHFEKLAAIEPELQVEFSDFARAMASTRDNVKTLKEHTDLSYLTSVKDQIAYNGSLKTLLKVRDQKQVDFEVLGEAQIKTTLERDQLASGYNNTGFIRGKVEDLRGLNHEEIRKDKLRKLEAQCERLQKETEDARVVSERFDEEVIREVAIFDKTKGVEMKRAMREFAQANVAFYQQIIADWENINHDKQQTRED